MKIYDNNLFKVTFGKVTSQTGDIITKRVLLQQKFNANISKLNSYSSPSKTIATISDEGIFKTHKAVTKPQ